MTTLDTITDDQIRALSDEAGAHGDLEMVAICQRALAGDAAAIAECVRVIESAEAPEGALAYKYADPTEDACWLYSEDDVRDVEREDPSLIVRVATVTYQITCNDTDYPLAWMDIAATMTPGAQDDGRCAYRATVDAARVDAFEAALDADADVLRYSVDD